MEKRRRHVRCQEPGGDKRDRECERKTQKSQNTKEGKNCVQIIKHRKAIKFGLCAFWFFGKLIDDADYDALNRFTLFLIRLVPKLCVFV